VIFLFIHSIPVTINATFKSDAVLGIDLPLMGDISLSPPQGFGKSMNDTKAYVIGLSVQFLPGNK
jgi:hypothetical protein